jgi:hypothetical protein
MTVFTLPLKHISFNMTHFASSVCRLARRSPQGVMGISTRPGGRLRWPTGFDFGSVWRRYTARPMRRIALCLAKRHAKNKHNGSY